MFLNITQISYCWNCFRVDLHYSLLDFIRGGLEFKLVIAIDFTVSIHTYIEVELVIAIYLQYYAYI
jgi:hypothetical protein